jgi:uncharacterized protein (TIGR02145 family)
MKKQIYTQLLVLILFSPRLFSQINCGDSLLDKRDGQKYPTIKIGNHCWMAKNLNAGIMLDVSINNYDQVNNGIAEKYCFNSNPDSCTKYGGLYQWEEVMNDACPAGWHIPSKIEFDSMINYFPKNKAVKELLPGGSSGFNLLFSGYGYYSGLKWIFSSTGSYVNLRTSTPGSTSSSAVTYYTYPGDSVFETDGFHPKKSAYSARCVMDIQTTSVTNFIIDPQIKLSLYQQNNLLYISYLAPEQTDHLKFTLYDSKGSMIKEINIKNTLGIITLNPADLKSGIYIGKLQLPDGKSITDKVFLQKE